MDRLPKMTTKTNTVYEPKSGSEGELLSFPDVYEAFKRPVRGTLFKLCGPVDLDDVVQECFTRIWKGLPKFRGGSSLKTWIYSIVVRTGIDHLRSRRKHLTALDPSELPAASNPEREQMYRDLIFRGLSALTLEHRTVLILHAYEGLSLDEVATVTSTQPGTVKSRLHYARKAFLEFLEQNGVRL
jgi:RNA polymerase sigma-70 factor, ECF subfamily